MSNEPCLYSYEGPVTVFGRNVADHWTAQTYAVNARRAKANMAYQYKRENNLVANVPVKLTGNVKKV